MGTKVQSGYCDCACRDCFDVAITSDTSEPALCSDCCDAGCDESGESECARPDAYGVDEIPGERAFLETPSQRVRL